MRPRRRRAGGMVLGPHTWLGNGPLALPKGGGFYPMPLWSAAQAAVQAGTRDAKLIWIGDSTCNGARAIYNNPAYEAARASSWPILVGQAMASPNVDAWAGSNGVAINVLGLYNPRFTAIGSGWNYSGTTLGGSYLFNSTTTNLLTYAPDLPFDAVEIWTPQNTGLGVLSVDIDGGTATIISQAGAAAVIKTVVSAPLGLHSINIQRVSGSAFVSAIVPINTSTKRILTYQCGVDGQRIDGPIAVGTTGPLNAFKVQAPDLTVICLTINDWNANTDTTLFESRTQTLIDAAKLTGDVILMTGCPTDPSQTATANQDAKVASYRALAALNKLNLIDIYAAFGTWASANAKGWMADASHPKAAGYTEITRLALPTVNRQ